MTLLKVDRIKICCIMSQQDADIAIECGATCLGLVAQMPSGPGIIDSTTISNLVRYIDNRARAIVLTSEKEANEILRHVDAVGVETVQVVSPVEPSVIKEIKRLAPALEVIPVVHVIDKSSIDYALRLGEYADAILLDTGNFNVEPIELGGTGRTHDWEVSADIVSRSEKPIYLAGGLDPENVIAAINQVKPHHIDVCSRLRRDGALDRNLCREFIARIRSHSWN